MKLGLHQSVRPDLQLRLSPQMLQRIEVLQLSALDLNQLIEQELQENETIEAEPDGEPEAEPTDPDSLPEDPYEGEENWERIEVPSGPSRMDVMAATATAPISLAEHLTAQLELLDLKPRELIPARAIIEALNDRGWLPLDLDELEIEIDPAATSGEREHALHLVQGLEPPGIGSRDLTECLLLQISPERPDYELLVSLVVQHLDDIAHNRIPRIVRETGCSVEQVLSGIEVISHLDPIPGRRFGGTAAPHVRPDVLVRRVGDGYEIALENDWIPNLVISRSYRDMARNRSVDPELRRHIRGKIDSAQSLIEAIEQRKNTLFRVASELVNRQSDYLEQGPAGLRPLRMQEVADALGVHVSTVSRAIAGKYLQTPRGIHPMKALFTGEVPTRDGRGGGPGGEETASRAGVQQLVKGIVAAEDPHKPLSDEAIVSILKDQHALDIARRTVTKYRKALGIGSSRARRVYGPA
jgi:RNA polymerase sigma-54 factor